MKWEGDMGCIDVAVDKNRCGNEPSGSVKVGEFLDKPRNYPLLHIVGAFEVFV